jgi:hypothetical protein
MDFDCNPALPRPEPIEPVYSSNAGGVAPSSWFLTRSTGSVSSAGVSFSMSVVGVQSAALAHRRFHRMSSASGRALSDHASIEFRHCYPIGGFLTRFLIGQTVRIETVDFT